MIRSRGPHSQHTAAIACSDLIALLEISAFRAGSAQHYYVHCMALAIRTYMIT